MRDAQENDDGLQPGQWPVGPQEDDPIQEDRIWVDGCFDFAHHGHAGAMLQARRLGRELYVGVHSDEAILENKGPTVMNLKERLAAVDACRWATKSIPHAPYVTSLAWISHYGCWYVGHGDDVTSDSGGEDCYRFVKAAGRFKIFKRTPHISTTDLVGRMLLCTREHFIKSLLAVLDGSEGPGSEAERKERGEVMWSQISNYATDETGMKPGARVWNWTASEAATSESSGKDAGEYVQLASGKAPAPRPGQRVVYVDGGFDLFSSGHIEFLRQVTLAEEDLARSKGWYAEEKSTERIRARGEDYGPIYLVAGVHDDRAVNHWKGVNYPIMNIFERGLCVLQCKYVHAMVFGAPLILTEAYLDALPVGLPAAVYHGPTDFMPLAPDPYATAKALGIFRAVGPHAFDHVNASEIVQRIMRSRAMYEERQRKKGEKAAGEEAAERREKAEREAAERSREKRDEAALGENLR